MRSRFARCRTVLIVSGKSSSFAARAAAIFFANDRLPAMRSLSSGSGLWIEIWTWSSPASLSASARARVNSVPAVMSDEYRPTSRAPAHSSTRSRRSIGSPPVSASCSTPSRRASLKTRSQCSVSSSPRYRSPPMSTGFEQYGQCSGHWYESSAISVDGLDGIDHHEPLLCHRLHQFAHVVAHIGALVARRERAGDGFERALTVAQREHLRRGRVEPHDALGDQQHVLFTHVVVLQPRAGHQAGNTHGWVSPRSMASSCAHSTSVLKRRAATAASCCSGVRQRSTHRSSAYCASRGASTRRERKYSSPAGSNHV